MSTFNHLMPQVFEAEPQEAVETQTRESAPVKSLGWDPESFAQEQIRGLVRSLFLTGSKPSRQIVFSAVDRQTDISALCRRVAESLSSETSGCVCLLDSCLQTPSTGSDPQPVSFHSDQERFGRLRDSSLQLSNHLWYMSAEGFRGEHENGASGSWLKARFSEFRLEFDYLVIQAPACGVTNQAASISRLCDGLVLILEANVTRRASAHKVKQSLAAAHVRLLGTVLSERTFPIPKAIYERV
jgi:protein-tyrosine kinase